tara:strand:+ start:258 stop:998 length:741 start_codon:yes stop_codon:yes gene_type:complete
MSANLKLMGNVNRQTRIYRVFPQDYFFELFEEKKNALVLPAMWHDPFENVVLRSSVKMSNGEIGIFGFHDQVYGQCWSLHRASDAMWQIYSKDRRSIRVRTTVGQLIDSLSLRNDDWTNTSCFIGCVDYLTDNGLGKFAKDVFKNGISPLSIAHSLMVKRKAYVHEKEVRLIFLEPHGIKHLHGVYKYEIDPLSIFDQVMIDGRISPADFTPLKHEISKRTGLSPEQVKRSKLYDQPKNFVVEISV